MKHKRYTVSLDMLIRHIADAARGLVGGAS
jgi:hypothetical protein